jgi:hypothetical protein
LSKKITKSWAITFLKGAEVLGVGCGPPPLNVPSQPAFFSHPPSHTHSHWPHLKEIQKYLERNTKIFKKEIQKNLEKKRRRKTDRALHHGGLPLS